MYSFFVSFLMPRVSVGLLFKKRKKEGERGGKLKWGVRDPKQDRGYSFCKKESNPDNEI